MPCDVTRLLWVCFAKQQLLYAENEHLHKRIFFLKQETIVIENDGLVLDQGMVQDTDLTVR